MHLAIWGEVDPASSRVRMSLGLPARTLAAAGLRAPADYMLPLAVRGTLTRPQVDWVGCAVGSGEVVIGCAAGFIANPGVR